MKPLVTVKLYEELPFDYDEIKRYAGSCDDSILPIIKECAEEIKGRLSNRVCFARLDISELEKFCNGSCDLSKNLNGCSEGVLFAATVGLEIDRLIARYSRVSPSKALVFQAIGAERIESLCNAFNDDIKREALSRGLFARSRFSPGYGDFSIAAQKDIFLMLDCPRRIGLTLNDSLVMSPSKSVTAVIGLSHTPLKCSSGCDVCNNTGCDFRR